MSDYRALADLYLPNGRYAMANDVLSDSGTPGSVPVPIGWIPATGAVDPLTSDAVQALWNVGPTNMANAEIGRQTFIVSRWSGTPYSAPSVYWKRLDAGHCQLTGAGAALGPKLG